METLEQPESASPGTKPDLNLLLETERADERRRWRSSAVVSIAIHAVVITALLLMPGSLFRPLPPDQQEFVHVTPVFEPTDLTQTTPNKGPISKQISAEAIAPRPPIKSPSPAPAAKQGPPPAPPPPAAPPPATPAIIAQAPPKPVIVEPPKVQPDSKALQAPEIAQIVPAPTPVEPPKPALQNPPAAPNPAQGRSGPAISIPNPSVEEAMRNLTRTAPQGGQSVGDLGVDEGGSGMGLNLPPSAGQPRSNLELRSDPMGVDFRPYLLQVLASVRRNWKAVFPEAARLGQRGQVTLEFAVIKQGTVTKVVFTGQSGAKALDQAAVAAISASNPLPPLPTEFKGDRIVLAMTFMYNMPR
jgi:homeobox protein ESX1